MQFVGSFSDRNYHVSVFHVEQCRKNINNFIILNGSVSFSLGAEEIKQTEISPENCIKNAPATLIKMHHGKKEFIEKSKY